MKRTLTLFCLGLALTFALAGCTRDKTPNVTPTPAGGSPVSTPSGEPMRPDGTVRPDETYRPSPTPIPEGTLNPTGTRGGLCRTARSQRLHPRHPWNHRKLCRDHCRHPRR